MECKIELRTKLDRGLQRIILTALANCAPRTISGEYFEIIMSRADDETVAANLHYLQMHGLLTHDIQKTNFAGEETFSLLPEFWAITEKGIDFVSDDGGLSAILGVVTVRLHEDTIREMIVEKIEKENPPDRQKLISQLQSLRGASITHLTTRLIDAGLDNASAALPLIRSALGF